MYFVGQILFPSILKVFWVISINSGVQTNIIEPKSLLQYKENVKISVPVQIVSNINQHYVKDKTVNDGNIDVLLKSIAKDIVDALLQRQNAENKLTDLVTKLLNTTDNKHPTNAIENKRLLDYLSKKSASYIETYANNIATQELKTLVTGLAYVSSEIAITAALKDMSWAGIISKMNSYETVSQRKRSIPDGSVNRLPETNTPAKFTAQSSNFSTITVSAIETTTNISNTTNTVDTFSESAEKPFDMYSLFSENDNIPVKYVNTVNDTVMVEKKPFINKTDLDSGKRDYFERITLYQSANQENPKLDPNQTDSHESDMLYDISEVINVDFDDTKEVIAPSAESKSTTDYMAKYFSALKDKAYSENSKTYQTRMKYLENKATSAISYSSDVAFSTADTLIATRRTMTAYLEVVMAVKMASDGVLDRKMLMTSLAKAAAQQAAKEAKNAKIKALDCQKSLQQAMKYTSQAVGAKSYGFANRVSIDAISLEAISKSMAAVSLEVAMNTLFETNRLNE